MSLVSLRVSAYVCERLEEAVTVRGGKEVCERTMVEGLSQWVFSVRMIMEREREGVRDRLDISPYVPPLSQPAAPTFLPGDSDLAKGCKQ